MLLGDYLQIRNRSATSKTASFTSREDFMDRSNIIVVDGVDGTGKATATAKLLQLLNERHPLGEAEVLTTSFPRYDQYYGKLVDARLRGDDAPEAIRVPPEIRADPFCATLPYAADRYWTYWNEMLPRIMAGHWYLLDRFISSNMAHMAAMIPDEAGRSDYLTRLFQLEHGYFGLPKPDEVFILSLPEEIRQARTEKRRQDALSSADNLSGQVRSTDIHEQNLAYMAEVAKVYDWLTVIYNWHKIDCVEFGHELTPDEIAEKIYALIVKARLV
jgi:dTMP kinase